MVSWPSFVHFNIVVLTVGAKLDGARLGDSVGFVLGSADGFGYVEKDKISIFAISWCRSEVTKV